MARLAFPTQCPGLDADDAVRVSKTSSRRGSSLLGSRAIAPENLYAIVDLDRVFMFHNESPMEEGPTTKNPLPGGRACVFASRLYPSRQVVGEPWCRF